MRLRRRVVVIDGERCRGCGFCITVNTCRSPGRCIGCLSCYWSCPYEARVVREEVVEARRVRIVVDGVEYEVHDRMSVAETLETIGFRFDKPGSKKPSLPCRTGSCWACAVVINGSLERSCITPVRDGMRIETNVESREPPRIVHDPEPHLVGGKATPWWEVDYERYVEAAVWVAGCNLRCPQCQNYTVTYDNTTPPMILREAARAVVACHRFYNTRCVAISGGELTLNRRWLVEFFREASRLVKPKVRRHLDSNGTLLTPDYIDELAEAVCNNIGVEPKYVNVETYMRITA